MSFFILFFCVLTPFVFAEKPSVIIIQGEPETTVFARSPEGEKSANSLGVVGKDGLLVLTQESAKNSAGLIFSHKNASKDFVVESFNVSADGTTKIKPEFLYKSGTLSISALPPDCELYLDGKHIGRGIATLGNIPSKVELYVEARSAKYGQSEQKVILVPGESKQVKLDLRNNPIVNQKAEGRIVLPDVPLVLSRQKLALVRVDGRLVSVEDGVINGVSIGEHIVSISLPLNAKQIIVWKGAMPARSIASPNADKVATVREIENDNSKKETPASQKLEFITGTIVMIFSDTRFMIETSAKNISVNAEMILSLADNKTDLPVTITAVSGNTAMCVFKNTNNTQTIPSLKEGDTFKIKGLKPILIKEDSENK